MSQRKRLNKYYFQTKPEISVGSRFPGNARSLIKFFQKMGVASATPFAPKIAAPVLATVKRTFLSLESDPVGQT